MGKVSRGTNPTRRARANSQSGRVNLWLETDRKYETWCCEINRYHPDGTRERYRKRSKDLDALLKWRDEILDELEARDEE